VNQAADTPSNKQMANPEIELFLARFARFIADSY
jgi:hypothetical protein